MSIEAMKRVAEKLRRAGASIPAPEVTGTIEGSVVTGLCIALALVEGEIEALAQEKALQNMDETGDKVTAIPKYFIVRPADLEALGLTVDQVKKLIKEKQK